MVSVPDIREALNDPTIAGYPDFVEAIRNLLTELEAAKAEIASLSPGTGIGILRLPIGASVVKVTGYGFPGTIVAAFHTLAGQERFVVEATGDANGHYAGMLHIFNGDQLDTVENRKRKAGA
jgi:hypothetical protein